MLSTEKLFEMFPRQNGVARISESFALYLIISVPLTNKYLLHHNARSNKFFCYFQWRWLIIFYAVNAVPSNFCVDLSPRNRISFFLLSTCTEGLIFTPKIISFLPNPLPNENSSFLSNPIPYPEYLYSSISTFSVNLTG